MSALQTVLDRLPNPKRSGAGWISRCPAHEDSNPSLSIAPGRSGGVLLHCHARCSFESIARALGIEPLDLAGDTEPTRARLEKVAEYTYRNADATIAAWKVRFRDETGGKTFRWERPDPARPDRRIPGGNSDAPLYRLPELLGASPDELVIIVEGEKDADRLASLGFVVTTTPNGAGCKWREADSEHFKGRRVAIITDDDDPGRAKAKNTAEALAGVAAAVGVITLPNPAAIKGFDASDFLDSGGTVEKLRTLLDAFDTPRLPAEVAPTEVIEERVLALYRRGGVEPGIYPGWKSIAPLFRPKLGQLAVVTGSPGAGKSTWLDDFIIRTSCADSESGAECARWNWLLWSAEQYPVERHAAQLAQKLVEKPFGEGPSVRMHEKELRNALSVLGRFVTILDPQFSSLSIDRILEIAVELNAQSRRHALLIDPFNVLAATSRGKGESEHDFINAFLTKLRTFAHAEQMFVAVVAHPTKLRREEGADEYPVVRPWDISGSAHWYNHSDYILSIWRALKDEERIARGEVELHVSKVRFAECGTLGMTRLYFDRVTTTYREHPPGVGFRHVPASRTPATLFEPTGAARGVTSTSTARDL